MQDHGYPITRSEYHRRVDAAFGAAGRACWPAFVIAIILLLAGVADEAGFVDLPREAAPWITRVFLACVGAGLLLAVIFGDGKARAVGLQCPRCRRLIFGGTMTSVLMSTRGTCPKCGVRVLADVG